jgi:pyruvate-formate lyase-activating enzyme
MISSNAPHILFVNPWIHDFAAFDFWARPMGLMQLVSIVRSQGMHVSYIDCLNRFHPNADNLPSKKFRYGRGAYIKTQIPKPKKLASFPRKYSRYGILPEWFVHDLKVMHKPDVIMITSIMTYWYPGVQETIHYIRTVFKDVPIVLGGIYVRLCLSHAKKYMDADILVSDPGELVILKIIEQQTGFQSKLQFDIQQLDTFPYPAWDLQNKIPFVPLLTTRGCPFRCDYCASGFLEKQIRRRSIDHVCEEILYWYQKFHVRDFVFYDDALLYQSEKFAIPLLEKIISHKLPIRFHTPNAIHIREITEPVAKLLHASGFKNLRMGLETMDFKHRMDHKLTFSEFDKAINNLKNAGFQSKDLGAYLLIGLPEQKRESINASIDCVKESGVKPILAYYTPIPHTKLWTKAVELSPFAIAQDPIYTNNTIFPCQPKGLDWKELSEYQSRTKSMNGVSKNVVSN